MKTRKNQQTASSAVQGGRKINDSGVEVIKNTESLDHWDFLEEIEAPMWADLSVFDLVDDEIDDPWFNISHQFHECSSSQLLSTVFHPDKVGGSTSINIQEPPSPNIPPSVSKSRGRSYKTKEWEQRSKVTSNKQHPVKTLIRKSSGSIGSRNNAKPTSRTEIVKENEGPKTRSSCDSGLTDTSRNQCSKSSSSSLARQEQESSSKSTITSDGSENQEKKCLDFSCQTSSHNGLLSSLRINLRRSRATRPAARVVANSGKPSEGCKSSSSKSSAGSHLDQGSVGKKFTLGDVQNKQHRTLDNINITRDSQPLRSKSKVPSAPNVTKARTSNVGNLSNREGSNTLASKGTSKGKVQQHTSTRKVLMPHKANQEYQITIRKADKVGVGRHPTFPTGTKENPSVRMATHPKAKPRDKQSVAQKNVITKPIALKPKENANNRRSRDKDPAIPARKVYCR